MNHKFVIPKIVDATYRIVFTPDDVKRALVWAREHGYSYERHGEWAELLLAAYGSGIVEGMLQEAELND